MDITLGLTFDDVLLIPAESDVLPSQADARTRVSREIALNIPILSSAMDTVTEADMAIAMAQLGGIGVLHRNMSIEEQCEAVRQVKRYESGMVVNPITIAPDAPLAEAQARMDRHRISGIPVTEKDGRLVGILTHRDVRFAENPRQPVSELMTHENLATVRAGVRQEEARRLLHQRRIEKLLVVDDDYRCVGLITVKDIEKAVTYPDATKDAAGRLRVAAASTVGDKGFERTEALVEAELDLIVIDTAHGHSDGVIERVRWARRAYPQMSIIAGNIVTGDAAKALVDAGADAVKVGIGPGSICTTRVVAGVGVPQISAVGMVAEALKGTDIGLIADGGIRYSGDIAKALAAGADCVMIGGMFAGTEEAPGEVELYQGRSYKSYRGMGSLGAMQKGSKDRYFQDDEGDADKLVPEGIEGRVPYRGPLRNIVHQLAGGLRAAMGYVGCASVADMRAKPHFVRITSAGVRESHVHDVTITKEAPNYRLD
jgi:IMP dehydrogenase